MNQFKNAWAYTFINWRYFLILGLPLMSIEFTLAYLVVPLSEITQPDDFISFFESNSLIIGLVGMTGIIVQVSFLGGLYISYMSIESNIAINPRNALAAGLSKFFPLLGAYLLITLVTTFGYFLLVIPGVYLSARFSLFAAQIMFENNKVGESISASWEKTDQHSIRIFVLTLTFFSLAIISSIVITSILPAGVIQLIVLSLVEYIFVVPLGYIYFTLYKSLKTD